MRSDGQNRTILALLPVILSVIAGCEGRFEPLRRETTAMDTFLSVSIYDGWIGRDTANALIDSVFLEVARIEMLATDYSDDSEVGRINLMAGEDTVGVSGEILMLLRAAEDHSILSGGSFDVTIGPVVHRWDFLGENPVVPSAEEMDELLKLVDFRRVSTSASGVYLEQEGMRLDLGGIAKGYAVDRSTALLQRNGLKNFIVDLGGNLGISWEGTDLLDSTKVTVDVRHPRVPGKMFGHFGVGTSGVATSGDYQRFFQQGGIRYHHILDPGTGFPAPDVVSVTILAGDAITADLLSTSVFVLGKIKGMDLIERLDGVEGVMIIEEGRQDSLRVLLSPGMTGNFHTGESRD